MTFGLQPQGFIAKRLSDVLSDYTQQFQQVISQNVDLDNSGPFGQLLGINADLIALLWEILDQLVQSSFPSGATGILLDQMLALVNLLRLAARATAVQATVAGTPGTVIPAGSIAATSDTQVSFASVSSVTIPAGGSIVTEFDCVSTGPTPCLAGTLTVIKTPVTGWASITNALDGMLGADVETDAAYNIRRASAYSTVASSSNPGVLAAILKILGVTEVKEIENVTDITDGNGQPPHSYQLVIVGGADSDISRVMFATKPSGIRTFGTTTDTVIDLHGDPQSVSYSRPVAVPVYLTVNLTVDGGFPANGIAQITNAILAYGQTALKIGETVAPFKIEQQIETPGIVVFDLRLDKSANPIAASPIFVGPTQQAQFDSTRLLVQIVARE